MTNSNATSTPAPVNNPAPADTSAPNPAPAAATPPAQPAPAAPANPAPSTETPPAQPANAAPKGEPSKPEDGKTETPPVEKKASSLLFNKKDGDDKAKDGEPAEKKEGEGESEKPTEYADFKLPEGVELADADKTKLVEFAKGLNLSQDQAQAMLDQHLKNQQEAETATENAWLETKDAWADEVKADPVLGGANLEKTISTCDNVVRQFASDEAHLQSLQDDLMMLGLGNKKSFIQFLNNVANATKNDSIGDGKSEPTAQQVPIEKRMWPGMA